MLSGVIEVKIHLAGVGVGKSAELQIDEDQAAESSMKKEQVHAVPIVADPKSLLAGHESKIVAKFEQEVLQTLDQRFFQFVFGVFVFQAEEFKHERVPDVFVRRELIAWLLPCREVPACSLRALVKLRGDLPIQLANRPSAT